MRSDLGNWRDGGMQIAGRRSALSTCIK